MMIDIRYALRGMRRDRGFTIVTIISFAFGISAISTAVAIIDAIDFRPLPYAEAEQLAIIGETTPTDSRRCGSCYTSIDAIRLLQAEGRSIRGLAFLQQSGSRWFDGDRVERILSADVSLGFFSVLGVAPSLGRTFTQDDIADGARVVVLASGFWRHQLGADPAVIGRELDLATSRGRGRYVVIGVMPPDFTFLDNQAWFPLAEPARGSDREYVAIARQRPGLSISAVAAEARTLIARLASSPTQPKGSDWRATALPLRDWLRQSRPEVGRGRLLLFAVAGFVLMVVVFNVASLSLARARPRFYEVSVRSALGATRARLCRQFITESLLLVCCGGGLGLLLADRGIDIAQRALNLDHAGFVAALDWRVIGVTCLLISSFGIAAGLVPAWFGLRSRPLGPLGRRGTTDGPASVRFQTGLVILEVTASTVLLAAGALVGDEFLRLYRDAPGFDPSDLYLVSASSERSTDPDRRRDFAHRLTSELDRLAAVIEVGLTGLAPPLIIRDQSLEPLDGERSPMLVLADSALFSTVEVRPLTGRRFSRSDRAGAPAVAIANVSAARQLWPGENALGKRVILEDSVFSPVEIVGVVPDIRLFNAPLKQPVPAILYLPFDQMPTAYPIAVARARGEQGRIVPELRRLVSGLMNEPAGPSAVAAIEQLQSDQIEQERLHALTFNAFALVALFLACVGIYGIMSFAATQRSREIGIRLALGASAPRVVAILLRSGLKVAAIGVAAGVIGSLLAARLLSPLWTPGTGVIPLAALASAGAILAAVLVAAISVPAFKAGLTDPATILRD